MPEDFIPYMSRLIISTGKLIAWWDLSALSSISGICFQLLHLSAVQEQETVSLVAKNINALFLNIT